MRLVCVLRSGGDFSFEDVERLRDELRRQVIGAEYEFCCLTDMATPAPENVKIIPLHHDWPGWWSKMELFKLQGPVLYFDLDTVLLGSIASLWHWVYRSHGEVLMTRDFYHGDEMSCIMGWYGDLRWLYEAFAKFAENAQFYPRSHGIGCAGYGGDQEYIREHLRKQAVPVTFAQDVQRGIYSYKVNIQPTGVLPADASIVCFHGRPRPWEVNLSELKRGVTP
jgi:hypothetical protein